MPDVEGSSQRRVLPQRSTRGRRMHELVGEELEAEDLFWNQDALREEAEEDDFRSSEASQLSDADDAVSSGEEQVDAGLAEAESVSEEAEREVRQVERAHEKSRRRPRVEPSAEGRQSGIDAVPVKKRARRESVSDTASSAMREGLRHSTKRATVEAAQAREQRAQEGAERAQRVRERMAEHRAQLRPLTQEERLQEALEVTEPANRADLQRLLQLEDEWREKSRVQLHNRPRHRGRVLWHTAFRNGDQSAPPHEVTAEAIDSWVAFRSDADIPPFLRGRLRPQTKEDDAAPTDPTVSPPRPSTRCVVTGRPARYRDPHTGLPFADAAAQAQLWRSPDRYATPARCT
ncbi:hypothetical protein CDCA_CDCA09G2767 [Cyanidium caldarium]|uniref:Vps72/YL1 C-terminal domain-containing protein n=1 Tax=Cyanidium caldarium TaxID=2771 RepID=A0AAV9IWR0_CYACA|nr:hypothetical protein CDCA_CDCA09G2767 [Cyanidium caldarium]